MTGDWRRDQPDNRDKSFNSDDVRRKLLRLRLGTDVCQSLRDHIPISQAPCDRISSVALACTNLCEYFLFRVYHRRERLAALFLDRIARRLSHVDSTGPLGIRGTLRALVRFGIPPLRYVTEDSDGIVQDPVLFGFEKDFNSIRYFRLDPVNFNGQRTLRTVRAFVSAGFPAVFGFAGPESLHTENVIGGWRDIRPVSSSNPAVRGQAGIVVGFDDDRSSPAADFASRSNDAERAPPPRGALLVRHFIPQLAAHDAFLWLPYTFVEQQQAVDFWTILDVDWLNRTSDPGLPPLARPNLPGLT